MSHHHHDAPAGDMCAALRASILTALPDAQVEATGGGGHYTLVVTSTAFAGKGMVDSQRLVYGAIAHLMKGDNAPVHAIDSLRTRTP
jgi:acid stress-induced BolA-like protein IbaG/YrbA